MIDEEIVSLFSPMFDFVRNPAVPNTQRPRFLAHYTTLGVLEKIIKTEEVWLSNPLFMNDLQEMRFGMGEGARIFNQLCAGSAFEEACGSKERVAAMQSAFNYYFHKFDVEHALDVNVFCLSEHDPQHPDGRLSMWRAYGGNGDGVALVFNTDFITFNKDSPLLIAKVIYASEEDRIQWLRRIFAAALDILKQHQIPDDKLHIAAHQIFTVMLIFSLISKHHGFSEENEYRIIYLPEGDVHKILAGGFHYVIGSQGVEPKLRLPIKPLGITPVETWTFDSILDRIILGPGVSSSLSVSAIARMLDMNGKPGFKQKLWTSGIPLREKK
jgi:hypothetical protein